MAQSLIEQDGVTLIEQVVSLLLGSVLITSLYAYFRAELHRTVSVESKTATLEDARGALDIMLRDLMNAGAWASGVAPLETGVADDPDHDADLVCNRVYAASPSAIAKSSDWCVTRIARDRSPAPVNRATSAVLPTLTKTV